MSTSVNMTLSISFDLTPSSENLITQITNEVSESLENVLVDFDAYNISMALETQVTRSTSYTSMRQLLQNTSAPATTTSETPAPAYQRYAR